MLRVARPVLVAVAALSLVSCASEDAAPPAPEPSTAPTTTSPSTSIARPSTTTTTPPTTTTTTAPVDVFALRPPAPGSGPAALAEQIAAAEAVIRDDGTSEEALAAAALAQQVAYRKLGGHPEWDAEVFAALPEAIRPTVLLNVQARRTFRGMLATPSTTLPAWQIVPPAPADDLLASYHEAEAAFGIRWQYLAAINLVESAAGRIRGLSTAGAQGPMQFMPATWDAYGAGGDVNDPHDAIMGAARYLAANGGAHDIANALYRYNHSDRYVRGVQLYADAIAQHPRAFFGYYHWGVWYVTDQGDVYLPVGYAEREPVPVAQYRAR